MNLFKKKEKNKKNEAPLKKEKEKKRIKPPKERPSTSSAPDGKTKALRFTSFLLGVALIALSAVISAYDAKTTIGRTASLERSVAEAELALEQITGE